MSCSSDDQSDKECPLCMEPLEIDDVDFYPCKCEYQICRFCWHRLKNDENGLCPACRQPYPEDPVNFKPLSSADLQRIKDEKKLKQQAEKLRVSESRKHLANFRVLQKNLVYVVGLSPRFASEEILKKPEWFGRFGKIIKIVTGTSASATLPAHLQPSHTAYVTYSKVDEALRAIQGVNNTFLDGRVMKASLGTTKYCSSFLRSQVCGKSECMYLHDIADSDISFTKEDMHSGKHTEYEKRLIDTVLRKGADRKTTNSCWDQNGKDLDEGSEGYVSTFGEVVDDDGVVPESDSLISDRSTCDKENQETRKGARAKQRQQRQQSPRETSSTKTPSPPPPVESMKQNAPSTLEIADSVQTSGAPSIPSIMEPKQLRPADDVFRFLSDVDDRGSGPVPAPAPRDEAPAPLMNWQSLLGVGSTLAPTVEKEKEKRPRPASPPGLGGLFSDDDLGFDPFSESTKGLAKLLEEERVRHHQTTTPAAVLQRGSLRDLWSSQPTSNFSLASGLSHHQPASQQPHQQQHHSPFDMFGLVPQQQQYMNNYLNGLNGLGSLHPHQQSQHQQSQPSSFADLMMPSAHQMLHQQASMYAPPPGLAPPVSRPNPPPQSMAEWQEGLKALLPNVNVRFASDMEPRWSSSHPSLSQVPPPPGFSVHNR